MKAIFALDLLVVLKFREINRVNERIFEMEDEDGKRKKKKRKTRGSEVNLYYLKKTRRQPISINPLQCSR